MHKLRLHLFSPRLFSSSSSIDIPVNKIRNFAIVAHVDHGKSTLSDRILEHSGVLAPSKDNKQVLDRLAIERERGITIKAQTASFKFKYRNEDYLLNLIDTPGHVDFSYEVSRSLSACDGVVLLVDSTDGVKAQTIAHAKLARDMNLPIIPVLNKIDLAHSDPLRCINQLKTILGERNDDEFLKISAKEGINIAKVLETVIERIPPPKSNRTDNFKCLVFDSWYDTYKGVILLVFVKNGTLFNNAEVQSCYSGKLFQVIQVGMVTPELKECSHLSAGQIGFIILNTKDPKTVHIGDTFTINGLKVEPFPGFQKIQPMVYAGLFPIDPSEYEHLSDAIEKLILNDSSVFLEKTTSSSLGLGFRLGFLGGLHMDVFRQRLEEEYKAQVLLTNPAVPYRISYKNGITKVVENPNEINPKDPKIENILERCVDTKIIVPQEDIGKLMQLAEKRRGTIVDEDFLDDQVMLRYKIPLSEVVENNFFNEIKSITRGYGSLYFGDTEEIESQVSRLEVMINGEMVDALTLICHTSKAQERAREIALKLKDVIKRQQFEVKIQVCENGKGIATEVLKSYRKDVTAKLYGGDQTRKKKLLDKQREGKKKMKMIGKVEIPKEAFLSLFRR